MKSFQELFTELQDVTGDSSAAQLVMFKRWINDTARLVAAAAPFLTLETELTVDTVDGQQGYQIPNKINKIRSVTVTVGDTIYRPKTVEDPKYWEYLESRQAGEGDHTQFFMRQGNQILLWPTPATDGSTITIRGRKKLKDMSLDDYTTGTIVTATNGDETIVGDSTLWTTQNIGNWIRIDYTTGDFEWYEISSITDATHLELVKPYAGTSIAAGTETYTIGEFSEIPEDYLPLLYYKPLALYYMHLEDRTMADSYWMMYDGGKEAGKTSIAGGLFGQLLSEELERTEGIYVEPLQADDLSIYDFAIPTSLDIE